MKKSILFILMTVMGVSNANDLCTITNGEVIIPNSDGHCTVEPDLYQVKIYEMMMCTSAPGAPTTATVMDLSMCESVWTSADGELVTVQNGVTTPLGGTSIKPSNNSYSHGYVRLSKDFTLKSSIKFSSSKDGDRGGSGVYCATEEGTGDSNDANSTTCGASLITAGSLISPLTDMGSGNNGFGATDANEGLGITAYLVDTSKQLASDVNDVDMLVGIQEFSTPIVVNNDSTKMTTSFNVSQGMSINHFSGSNVVNFNRGPFAVRISVQ